MTKLEQKRRDDNVQLAIDSLYERFPSVSGCRKAHTKKIAELKSKIAARKKELENDAKLIGLEAALAAERKSVTAEANRLHAEVDKLRQRFRLRGVDDKLIADVEKLSQADPVGLTDPYECD